MEKGDVGETYIVSGPCYTFREAFETAARVNHVQLKATWVPPGLLRALSKGTGFLEKLVSLPAEFSAEAMRATGGTTFYGDNSKAKRQLGYDPRPLEDGLSATFGSV